MRTTLRNIPQVLAIYIIEHINLKGLKTMGKGRLFALIALVIAIAMLVYPDASFQASLSGLKLWFEIVLPALLPFFAMADILMGLGVVHFMGALLEPIMRPVFRIPGVGAFAVAMGLAGGYPIGARITGELHRKNLCNQVEAERLLAFANTADPLFIVGAVAVGMFGMPEIGTALVLGHYLGALIVGFMMRFYARHAPDSPPQVKSREQGYLRRAVKELDRARKADGRSFGQLFGDTIRDTFASMLFIGGCIMMFSVLAALMDVSGIMRYLTTPFEAMFSLLGIHPQLTPAIIHGFFETTLGAQTASAANAPLAQKAMVASLAIGWSGLSVHSQVSVMIQGTKIRMGPYMLARLGHGAAAGIITLLLLGPGSSVTNIISGALPVFAGAVRETLTFSARLLVSMKWAGILGLGCTAAGGLAWLANRISFVSLRR